MTRAAEQVDAQLKSCVSKLSALEAHDIVGVRSILNGLALDARPMKDVHLIPGRLGSVHGVWVVPPHASQTVRIVYCHGCGFVGGSIELYAALVSRLALAARASVFFVDYRLAPECTFPAAHDDCWEAYREVRTRGPHGPSDAECVLVGDSCGGSLALATAVTARDAGIDARAMLVLSPFVDLTASSRTLVTHEGRDPFLTRAAVEACASVYAPGIDSADARLSPLNANLSGLPPLLILAGGRDPLMDDAVRLCTRALEAHVPASLHVWANLSHTWHLFPELPETLTAIELAGKFLRDIGTRS
jgi:epsilon-lactone hydrolase